ncbi:hypothetical protein Q8A67_017247 [Cirrhinus molitorella]|uniref:Uncharacterized protein n=1 Tax=Cirrhinus molitorella TaxID=172907 RepID=A0AA88PJ73_9TELE|nr:hypothetical protein Q8A67_017247 [Cirrhinus molitorella]
MATAPFICDVEASEESLRADVSSHQLRHRVCSYSLLQVLVGVLAVLVLALTGGVIWMKFQDCPEEIWHVRFIGTNTTFTAPRTQNYMISGMVDAERDDKKCPHLFKLHHIHDTQINDIRKLNISQKFQNINVVLQEGARLSVQLNCDSKINETSSELRIYSRHCNLS